MKICVAQTRSITGDIEGNIEHHKKFIDLATFNGADIVIFPELSLTGYEPKLADALATNQDDSRFDDFQKISNARRVIIGAGVPTKSHTGICISMILFQPHKARRTYSKKYIHPDEEAFFVSGQNFPTLKINEVSIGLAICYEISVPDHAQQAHKNGAEIYVASVAKSLNGANQASKRLSDIAKQYSIPVLMSNCLGPSDDFEGAGKTSIWSNKGLLVSQLNDTHEGILMLDTETQDLIAKTL